MDDKAIIKMLLVDKLSKKEIAKRLNLTEVAVRKKIQKLKEKGILLGNKPIVNYNSCNLSYSITGLDVEPEKLIEIIDKLKEIKEIIAIYLSSGDHTLMLEIVSDNMEKLKEIHKKISSLEGVKKVCPAIVHEVLKF